MATSGDNDKENWIQCSIRSCGRWKIYEKTGLPLPYSKSKTSKLNFTCRYCALSIKLDEALSTNVALKTRLETVEKKLNEYIKTSSDEVKSYAEAVKVATTDHIELDELKKRFNENGSIPNSAELSSSQLNQAARELQEIERRKMNLVISNLPENNQDVEDIVTYARESCSVQNITQDDIISSERLGRPGAKPRLVKIKLRELKIRKQLLIMKRTSTPESEASNQLHRDTANPNQKIVYFRPDLTKTQVEQDKILRSNWIQKGKDLFKISRGKIVPRNPQATDSDIHGLEITNQGSSAPGTCNETRDGDKLHIKSVGTSQQVISTPSSAASLLPSTPPNSMIMQHTDGLISSQSDVQSSCKINSLILSSEIPQTVLNASVVHSAASCSIMQQPQASPASTGTKTLPKDSSDTAVSSINNAKRNQVEKSRAHTRSAKNQSSTSHVSNSKKDSDC